MPLAVLKRLPVKSFSRRRVLDAILHVSLVIFYRFLSQRQPNHHSQGRPRRVRLDRRDGRKERNHRHGQEIQVRHPTKLFVQPLRRESHDIVLPRADGIILTLKLLRQILPVVRFARAEHQFARRRLCPFPSQTFDHRRPALQRRRCGRRRHRPRDRSSARSSSRAGVRGAISRAIFGGWKRSVVRSVRARDASRVASRSGRGCASRVNVGIDRRCDVSRACGRVARRARAVVKSPGLRRVVNREKTGLKN